MVFVKFVLSVGEECERDGQGKYGRQCSIKRHIWKLRSFKKKDTGH